MRTQQGQGSQGAQYGACRPAHSLTTTADGALGLAGGLGGLSEKSSY